MQCQYPGDHGSPFHPLISLSLAAYISTQLFPSFCPKLVGPTVKIMQGRGCFYDSAPTFLDHVSPIVSQIFAGKSSEEVPKDSLLW
eukprot:12759302-Ditylum_brightwellii.AAC.1